MSKGIIQAAVNGQQAYEPFAYFFNGKQYTKYDWKNDRVAEGYPMGLELWKLPGKCSQGIDAAVDGSGPWAGKAYFFKGDEYVRYDWSKDAPDEGYPKPLSLWNLPGDFSSGIDAAVAGKGPFEGKIYFFKGGQYVRYDLQRDAPDDGYPQPLSAWGLPAGFGNGVDAALNGKEGFSGKLYFFKGDQYVRYDWAADKVDSATPSPVSAWGVQFSKPLTAPADNDGNRLLSVGTWNGAARLDVRGGQVMHFEIKNVNVLGTTIKIVSNRGGKKSILILPAQTVDLVFDCFGAEPMGWTFEVETDSDAFIVAWKLFSSWVPGDAPNR